MPVEHLLGIPETVPIGRVAFGLAGDLFGVPAAGGQQGHILGSPAFIEKRLDLVVAHIEGVVSGAGDEPDVRAVSAEQSHGMVDQRLEGPGDLTGIADVLLQDQRHQRYRRRALAVKDPLAFVAEHVDPAGLRVAHGRQERLPPAVGEVLSFVDDDRIEPMPVGQTVGELEHLRGQVVFEELGGGGVALGLRRALGRAPRNTEGVELPDVAGLLTTAPRGGNAFEVGSQAVGVAEQRDALSPVGQPAGLFDSHECLTAPSAAADLHTGEQLDRIENDGLTVGEDVGGVLVLQRPRYDITLRQAAAAQCGSEFVDALGRQ